MLQHSVQVVDVELQKAAVLEGNATPASSVNMQAVSPVASSSTTSSQSFDGFEIASSFSAKRPKMESQAIKLEDIFDGFAKLPVDNDVEEVTFQRKNRTPAKK